MTESLKELIYRGCYKHGGRARYNPLCENCRNSAMAAIVELMLQQERRITELEKKWEERLNGNFKQDSFEFGSPESIGINTEYNKVAVVGEPGSLLNLISRSDVASVIQSPVVPTSAGSDQQPVEREDSVGRRRRREIFDNLGILHDEGGD